MSKLLRRSRPDPQQKLNKALQWEGFYQQRYGHSFETALYAARYWHPEATEEQLITALEANGVQHVKPIPKARRAHKKPEQVTPPGKEAGKGSDEPDRGAPSSGVRIRRSKRR